MIHGQQGGCEAGWGMSSACAAYAEALVRDDAGIPSANNPIAMEWNQAEEENEECRQETNEYSRSEVTKGRVCPFFVIDQHSKAGDDAEDR